MTSKREWTAGPLIARRVNESNNPWAVINPNGPHGDEIVAGFCSEGDATLYAAAPELYRELEELIEWTKGLLFGPRGIAECSEEEAYGSALAALARADGRES